MSTRPVLDFGRGGKLPANLDAGDDNRFQVGPGGVKRGGVAGGAGAENDEFVVLRQFGTFSRANR